MVESLRRQHSPEQIAETKWGSKRYLSMERLYELDRMQEAI